ncbi:MAG: glycosyltransferase [Bacteroidetes bacterium]|nr:glycosyltransferase [Bacteroidota bacterium]
MHIHFFTTGDFREGNGANSRFICYGKGLKKQGVNHTFHFILPSEFNDNGINSDSKGIHEGIEFNYLCGRVIRSKRFFGRFKMLILSWVNAYKLLFTINRTENIMYFYGPQALIAGPIILYSKALGFKVVIEKTEFHSLAQGEGSGFKYWISKGAYRLIEKNLSYLCDRVIVISRRLKKYYSQRVPTEKISLLPVIYDPSRFGVKYNLRTNTIGYIGSFGYKDGVPQIIEAFSKALKQNAKLKLRLIGYQNKSFDLNACLAKNGLSHQHPNIEITGQVYAKDIPALLGECDLLLMNRLNNPYANYGFPTKLAEYLATGRPVISTNVTDIDYYFTNGLDMKIIEAENVSQLAEAILERYNNYDLWSEMGLEGQKTGYRLFNYTRHTEFMCQIFNDLVKNKKPTRSESVLVGE